MAQNKEILILILNIKVFFFLFFFIFPILIFISISISISILDSPLTHIVTVDYLKQQINDEKAPFGHGYILAGLLAGISPKDYCDE